MRNDLRVRIKKRNQIEWLIIFSLAVSMLSGFFTDILSIPSAVKYSIDVMMMLLLVTSLINIAMNKAELSVSLKLPFAWILSFFVLCVFVYAVNYQSVLYFLWGLRNNFRFYVFFFACVLFLKRDHIDRFLKAFDIFFYANTVLCFIQYFLFGLKGDLLGGFFGIERGCNGYLNIFLVIIAIKSVVFYLAKKENLKECIIKCALVLLVATLAELKFFFVEFVVILIIAVLFSDFSVRKIAMIITGVVAVAITVLLLEQLFPHFEGFFSFDFFINSASEGGYSSSANILNRLTTIPIISKNILTDTLERWFGLGLGNCDTATYDFLKTPFYGEYFYLRYTWFSTAFLFLETGYVGMFMFFGFFVLVGILCFLISRKNKKDCVYSQIGLIAAVMCVLITIYNSSIRTEAAYMIYFALAIPFIAQKESVSNE